jgi:hypothetical protein
LTAHFHEHLASKLRSIGFKPSRVDNDFWIRKKGDHYEYLATYVDNILAFLREPMGIIKVIKESYSLKGVGAPKYNLGGNIDEVSEKQWIEDGVLTALSARTYIANVMEKLEKLCGVKQFAKAIFVDADHAHDMLICRLVTGVILFVNKTLVKWISKQQKTVKTSAYESELVASRIATDLAVKY